MYAPILAVIAVIALLSWNLITARGQWMVKAASITAVSIVSILILASYKSYLGWPSTGFGFPDDFHLKAVHIIEPNDGNEGGIYLWVTKYSVEDEESGIWFYEGGYQEPRSFMTDYTKETHKQAQKWQEALKKGETIVGKKSPNKGGSEPKNGSQGKNGKPDGGKGDGWNSSWGQKYEMHNLPPAVIPEKNKDYWKKNSK